MADNNETTEHSEHTDADGTHTETKKTTVTESSTETTSPSE